MEVFLSSDYIGDADRFGCSGHSFHGLNYGDADEDDVIPDVHPDILRTADAIVLKINDILNDGLYDDLYRLSFSQHNNILSHYSQDLQHSPISLKDVDMVVYFSNDKGLCYEMVSDDHIYRNHWPGIFTKDDRFIFIFLDMVTRQYFTDKSTNHGMYIQTCNNLCMNNDMQVFSESVKTTIPDVDSDNKRAVSNCYDDEICNYVAHKIASLIVLYCMCKRSPRYKR